MRFAEFQARRGYCPNIAERFNLKDPALEEPGFIYYIGDVGNLGGPSGPHPRAGEEGDRENFAYYLYVIDHTNELQSNFFVWLERDSFEDVSLDKVERALYEFFELGDEDFSDLPAPAGLTGQQVSRTMKVTKEITYVQVSVHAPTNNYKREAGSRGVFWYKHPLGDDERWVQASSDMSMHLEELYRLL